MNLKDRQILDIIYEDIEKSSTGRTAITNSEISKKLGGYSFPQVRDKICKLNKLGFIKCELDFWFNDKYYPRLISKGTY